MHRITIKDLAKMANVDPSTVSRALNNSDKVNEETKKIIQELAKSLNFTLNTNAINFKNQKTKLIALIIPEIGMFFIPDVIKGINKVLYDHNYKLNIFISQNDSEKEADAISKCIESNVEGIIISFCQSTKNLDNIKKIVDSKIPLVIIDKTIQQNHYPELLFDNKKDSIQCAKFLSNSNPKKVLAIMGSPELRITQDREKGFKEVFKNTEFEIIYAESSSEAEMKTSAFELNCFDGIYCMSDEVLLGFISEFNRQLPNFSSKIIISFSDGNLPMFLHPKVSFLHHDGQLIGMKATLKLLECIHSETFKKTTEVISSKIFE